MYIQVILQDQLRQNHIYPGGVATQVRCGSPSLPFFEGMSTVNKPSWDRRWLANRHSWSCKHGCCFAGRICWTTPLNVTAWNSHSIVLVWVGYCNGAGIGNPLTLCSVNEYHLVAVSCHCGDCKGPVCACRERPYRELCCRCPPAGQWNFQRQLPAPRANLQQPGKNILVFDGLVPEVIWIFFLFHW